MGEVFELQVSEGAISNMLTRARTPLAAAAEAIGAAVVAKSVVCSDETSARVSGKTWWGRVFLAEVPLGEPGRKMRKRIAANRAHLFVFVTDRRLPATNNVSERHLRPSVIFRKVTNGVRCEWGAETYAAFRSVVSTAKANRAFVLNALCFVIATPPYKTLAAGVG